ncbi:chemotaxis protein CheC [Methanolacinia paynteri]|uniref:chemotaxis protein CheC n=1 Tax=Methanolacinia paynteri TaxID=230356 RepID=UPI000AD26B30|nr:chemotaxis protein CheC [Methanolacinia paynteri]
MMSYAITESDIDAFRELINIGLGRSAGILNKITRSHVTLSIPDVKIIPVGRLDEIHNCDTDGELATVSLDYSGSFSGRTAVVFPQDSGAKLAMAVTGENEGSPELDAMKVEVLKEVGNILVSGVMGSISNVLKTSLSYSIPVYSESEIEDLIRSCKKFTEEFIIIGRANFIIRDLEISGNIIMILEMGSLERLLNSVRNVNG